MAMKCSNMARSKSVLKTVRGPPHSSIRQSDSQPLDLEHNRPSASAGRFECSLPGCSSSLGTKDAFKKHLQIHFLKKKKKTLESRRTYFTKQVSPFVRILSQSWLPLSGPGVRPA